MKKSGTLFTVPFGPTGVILNFKVRGSGEVSFQTDFQNSAQISLSAGLEAKGELEAGLSLLGVQSGVAGTFLKETLTGYINARGDISKSCSFTAEDIRVYIQGNFAGKEFPAEREIFGGWSSRC